MKIELQNICCEHLQRDLPPTFTAKLFINDQKVASVSGTAGKRISVLEPLGEDLMPVLAVAERFCESISQRPNMQTQPFTPLLYLKKHVDELLNDHMLGPEAKRFYKAIDQRTAHGLVYGKAKMGYRVVECPLPVKQMLSSERGMDCIVYLLKNWVLPELHGGYQLLNTNIPGALSKLAGLNPDQYLTAYRNKETSVKSMQSKQPKKRRL